MIAVVILVLITGACVAAFLSPRRARVVSLAALGLATLFSTTILDTDLDVAWLPGLGARFHLAADGLSTVLVLLTLAVGFLAVVGSFSEVEERVGYFHFHLLFVLAGVVGVFTAMDLLLFYVFWELMLVPMYFLIGIFGHDRDRRVAAAIKFFIFTQAGGLLMLLSIAGIALLHARQTGQLTFAYDALLSTEVAPATARWLMLGFFVGFAVKLPVVPLHTWLPDVHTEAPTAGSVVLAGLLLKTGAYGLIRFAVPLFPEASRDLAPVAIGLGIAGVLYGAFVAFGQTDLKRLVAYTSISHLGFVLIGVYSFTDSGRKGVLLQLVCHALSTGGLFLLVGELQERLGTRDMSQMGGLRARAPRLGAAALVLGMASLGLPGLGNFVAEILILFGAYQVRPIYTAIAVVGLVLAAAYALRMIRVVFAGPAMGRTGELPDLRLRELALMALIVLALVWLGLFPQPVLDMGGSW